MTLPCIVLAIPRDGSEPRARMLPTAEAMAFAASLEAMPDRYSSVAIAHVFRRTELQP